MRAIACLAVLAGLCACSGARSVVAARPVAPARHAPRSDAALALQDVKYKKEGGSAGAILVRSALPFGDAKLELWQAAAIVTEGVAGGPDMLEIQVAASDETDPIVLGMFVEKAIEPGSGEQITGRYPIRELVRNGPSDQLNVTVDGVLYGSVAGTVEFVHRPRSISGSFEVWVARDGDSDNGAIPVSGSFEGLFGLGCFALDQGVPGPNAQGGNLPLKGEPDAGPSWTQVGPSHDFCRQYESDFGWSETPR
jgi:hypothetical protein